MNCLFRFFTFNLVVFVVHFCCVRQTNSPIHTFSLHVSSISSGWGTLRTYCAVCTAERGRTRAIRDNGCDDEKKKNIERDHFKFMCICALIIFTLLNVSILWFCLHNNGFWNMYWNRAKITRYEIVCERQRCTRTEITFVHCVRACATDDDDEQRTKKN